MPVTPTYPGLYIEEVPPTGRSIVAAPTSIAVFVGYGHPFRTKSFGVPVRIFSFDDYERDFGPIFASGVFDPTLGHAVLQFFQNGGSEAYVVALRPRYQLAGGGAQDVDPPTATVATTGGGIVFTGTEPTDHPRLAMQVALRNLRASASGPGAALDTADLTVTYGTRSESLRGLRLGDPDLAGQVNAASTLLRIAPGAGGFGTAFVAPATPGAPITATLAMALPPTLSGTFAAADFLPVFGADRPLDKVEVFNLLLVPGITDNGVLSAALAFAERKFAFLIMDPPRNAAADPSGGPAMDEVFNGNLLPRSRNGAIYFPYLKSVSPVTGAPIELPPSGYVAGVYARTDARRGVWKAPAGLETELRGTTGVVDTGRMNDQRHGVLNKAGVNCLRSFPGATVVFGARTLVSANPAYQPDMYVPVRRMTLFIEQTLLANLRWAVFEPNDEPLWIALRTTVENFMLSLMAQQALAGSRPSEAFRVRCDRSTTTPDDQAIGIVNILVAFAPLRPAEFVVIRIAQLAGQSPA